MDGSGEKLSKDGVVRSAIGGIIGDICGSKYEFDNYRGRLEDLELFSDGCDFTDDSVMTVALMDAMIDIYDDPDIVRFDIGVMGRIFTDKMRTWGYKYPNKGYGLRFVHWLEDPKAGPYNSCGNGALMRIGPALYADKFWPYTEYKIIFAQAMTAVTHDHPMALNSVKDYVLFSEDYADVPSYDPSIKPDDIKRCVIGFDETCRVWDFIPSIVVASGDFEECIRLAVWCGGDCDTTACIAGSIKGYACGVPEWMYDRAMAYLPNEIKDVVKRFDEIFVFNDHVDHRIRRNQ